MEAQLTVLLLMVSQSAGELWSLVRALELGYKNTFGQDMAVWKACVHFSTAQMKREMCGNSIKYNVFYLSPCNLW